MVLVVGLLVLTSFQGILCLFTQQLPQAVTSNSHSGFSPPPPTMDHKLLREVASPRVSAPAEGLTYMLQESRHEIKALTARLGNAIAENKIAHNKDEPIFKKSDPDGCASSEQLKWWTGSPSDVTNGSHGLRVVTWNLWNLSEQWHIRKQSIATTLKELGAHVVGVQEVRLITGGTQLDELAASAGYSYYHYQRAGLPGRRDEEGVGIMSILPIVKVETRAIALSPESSDSNPRTALLATIDASSLLKQIGNHQAEFLVDVLVTHLSYDAGEQCRQIVQVRRYLDEKLEICEKDLSTPDASILRGSTQSWGSISNSLFRPQILMGDLNIYRDFEWPMDYLTAYDSDSFELIHSSIDENHRHEKGNARGQRVGCSAHWRRQMGSSSSSPSGGHKARQAGGFQDVWDSAGSSGHSEGWTFPNLKSATNDPARCDRILVRSSVPQTHLSNEGSARFHDVDPIPSTCKHGSLTPLRAAIVGCADIGGVTQLEGHGNPTGQPLRPSDHRAVVVYFALRPS